MSANALTMIGLLVGLAAAGAISQRAYALALALIVANRILDGLDGAVARVRGPSDFGGYLDSLCDFAFYVAVPLGFAIAAPANALPAAILIASFTITGVSFLAFAAIAAKRGLETERAWQEELLLLDRHCRGGRNNCRLRVHVSVASDVRLYCIFLYAALCLLTVAQRSWLAVRSFN